MISFGGSFWGVYGRLCGQKGNAALQFYCEILYYYYYYIPAGGGG